MYVYIYIYIYTCIIGGLGRERHRLGQQRPLLRSLLVSLGRATIWQHRVFRDAQCFGSISSHLAPGQTTRGTPD